MQGSSVLQIPIAIIIDKTTKISVKTVVNIDKTILKLQLTTYR
jgi:hypothetical protein